MFHHTFDYNCYYGRSPDAEIYSGESLSEMQAIDPAFEPNGFWADPLFANPQKSAAVHFQLLDGSPCLDRGAPLPVDHDYYGNERPQGSGLDMGVYERDANLACPPASAVCDDGDPSTYDDVADGDCNCAGTPCPEAGTACDDGNPNTVDDMEDGFCNCAGTSICPPTGELCDDGDPDTSNDIEDGDCHCAGIPCPPAGTACDDDDPNTFNDVQDGFCQCMGDPPACPSAGTPCDDGNPATKDDQEDGNCHCVGTPVPLESVTVSVNYSNNDVEEMALGGRIKISSSDLELGVAANIEQMIGIRFGPVEIQPGARIANAYIQLTVDEASTGSSTMTIHGEAADNAAPFTVAAYNVSNRPKTEALIRVRNF